MQYFTGKEGKGWLVVVWGGLLLLLLGFGFFFRFPQVSVFILQGKEMDLPIMPWMSQCVLGSCFVSWSQVGAECPPKAEWALRLHPWSGVKALRARSAAEGGAAAACKCRGMCSQ